MMKTILFIMGLWIVLGCNRQDDGLPLNPDATGRYTFDDGLQGWEAGVSDFPLGFEDSVMFESGTDSLPEVSEMAFRLAGNDVNQDLFMFITQKLGPVDPETSYNLVFTFNILVQNLEQVQGSGSDIFIFPKVGATIVKPQVFITSDTTQLGYLGTAFSIDKGNGSFDGADMIAMGALQLPIAPGSTTTPNLITNGPNVFRATTDSNGDLWITVGTDSESGIKHAVYLDNLEVEFFRAN